MQSVNHAFSQSVSPPACLSVCRRVCVCVVNAHQLGRVVEHGGVVAEHYLEPFLICLAWLLRDASWPGVSIPRTSPTLAFLQAETLINLKTRCRNPETSSISAQVPHPYCQHAAGRGDQSGSLLPVPIEREGSQG